MSISLLLSGHYDDDEPVGQAADKREQHPVSPAPEGMSPAAESGWTDSPPTPSEAAS